jgi:hypothetical protein
MQKNSILMLSMLSEVDAYLHQLKAKDVYE